MKMGSWLLFISGEKNLKIVHGDENDTARNDEKVTKREDGRQVENVTTITNWCSVYQPCQHDVESD